VIHQQIEIMAGGLTIHAQGAAQGSSIQQARLVVGQHGPEAAQGFSRNAWSQLGDVALELGANELFSPDAATGVTRGLHAVGEAAANPEAFAGRSAELQYREPAQLEIADAPGQAFAALSNQPDQLAIPDRARGPDAAGQSGVQGWFSRSGGVPTGQRPEIDPTAAARPPPAAWAPSPNQSRNPADLE